VLSNQMTFVDVCDVDPEGRNSMAKKKATKKKSTKKAASRAAAKKTAPREAAKKKTAAKPAGKKKKKAVAKKKPAGTVTRKAAARVVSEPPAPVKKVVKKRKGVRRATTTSGIRTSKPARKLGRSQIPIDAPLDIVFQNDQPAREAFVFLGIHTVRELEEFEPDELVRRLTSPAKQTVGRIRKILAMNNRSLEQDEAFALEFKERLSQTQAMR
jgi:hypothetical protein